MDLDDIKQILDLVREHDLAELELEKDGLKVRVRKSGHHVTMVPPVVPLMAAPAVLPAVSAPATAGAPPASTPAAATPATNAGTAGLELAVIKSPIVGTFYRSSEPGARPFVDVGDTVKKGSVLCIIEAMKLMNEIESDCDGEIAAIYVENGQPVQYGDRLFAVKVA